MADLLDHAEAYLYRALEVSGHVTDDDRIIRITVNDVSVDTVLPDGQPVHRRFSWAMRCCDE